MSLATVHPASVRLIILWTATRLLGARNVTVLLRVSISGRASAVKEPGARSQGRRQDFTLGVTEAERRRGIGVARIFPLFVITLKTQTTNAADCFTVKK